MALLQGQENPLAKILETNEATEKFGLVLREQDAQLILEERRNCLREQKRVEFGESIVPGIIYEFCDSAYLDQSNYVDTCRKFFTSIKMKCRMKSPMRSCFI